VDTVRETSFAGFGASDRANAPKKDELAALAWLIERVSQLRLMLACDDPATS